jgi:PAS domain S-box-containing protein
MTDNPLRDGEERYRRLAEASFEGVIISENGRITDLNQQTADLFGYTREDLIGREVTDLVTPDARGEIVGHGRTDQSRLLEAQALRKDGSIFPAEIRCRASHGERESIVYAVRDISRRKGIEERLQESEESYRELTDSISDVFYAFDKSLTTTHWNKASEYLTGISARDAIGRTYYELFPEGRGSALEELYLRALRTQHPQWLEEEFHTEEGKRFFEISIYPSRRGLSVFARDVTDRKRAEEAVRESEERFRNIYEESPIGILLYDANARLFDANIACLHIFRVPTVSALHQLRLFEDPNIPHDAQEKLRHGDTVTFETSFPIDPARQNSIGSRSHVDTIHIEVQITPLGSREGRPPTAFLVQVQDTTERALAEQELRASLDEKEALLKEIHHRVKNNLQIISSLLNLQSEHVTNKKALEALMESQSRVRSMALIHEQLYRSKDLARIDFGQYVRDLTSHIFRTYSVHASNVQLQLQIEEVTLPIDKAIPCGMIVNELVSNSLKYAFPKREGGHIRITIRSNDGRLLLLGVEDDGIGFPPDIDIPNATSLGLRLVRTLTDQLKGIVTLEREHGTRFAIRFPR